MDTLVIYLTGLLLFVPDSGTRQMHVVGPDVDIGVPAHVIQIGLVRENEGCADYERPTGFPSNMPGICYFNLNEWALDLFVERSDAQLALPTSVFNLTHRFRARLPRRRLTNKPTGDVRSRVTLGTGSVTDSCELAEWDFDAEELWLTNVIEWTITGVRAQDLRLVLNRLNHEPWEFWERRTRNLPPVQPESCKTDVVNKANTAWMS